LSPAKRRPISLNALATFECAARLQSFGAAAEELSLTRSAVSHQILKLEEQFGVRLFERHRSGVALTPAGGRVYERLRKSLLDINDITGELLAKPRRQRLTVQSAPTFAARWLVGRLDAFLQSQPQIDFQLLATSEPGDFKDRGLDLAISYGKREADGCETVLLLSELVQPLCSPALKAKAGLDDLGDLARATLIQTDLNLITWEKFLADHGVGLSRGARQIRLNPSYLALEAAVQGVGVVLESDILAHAEIASGRLLAPFDRSYAATNGYYLVRPRDERRRHSDAFCDWLIEEAAAFAGPD